MMKHYIFLSLIIVWGDTLYSQTNDVPATQYGEFKIYQNGLIYDSETMVRLGAIVDSLNVRFRSCDLSHPYYSLPQGKATLVKVPNDAAMKAINDGISLSDYTSRYADSHPEDEYVIKGQYTTYDGVRMIEYFWVSGGSITFNDTDQNSKRVGWLVTPDGDEAIYLHGLDARPIPYEYARLIQYVDCMIDTTGEIYTNTSRETDGEVLLPKIKAFLTWAERYPGKPKELDYDKINEKGLSWDSVYEIYEKRLSTWESARLARLDRTMKASASRRNDLTEAVNEALANNRSHADLEFYADRYGLKQQALTLMRSRRVIGQCSMDHRPRLHAMEICKLSAETAQWDIFLRSHLDIMNDRFSRVSDGSWAWAERQTYLKELEMLNINVIDLLLGTMLSTINVSDGHYSGSMDRVGRAIAETAQPDALERRLFNAICDSGLDTFNRILVASLFQHYAHNVANAERKHNALSCLEEAVEKLPVSVRDIFKK